MEKRKLEKSKLLLERAEKVIPRAAQTLSKAPDQFVRGVSPYAIERGEGCRVWDVDGNEYIDLASSLGAIVLGHRHPVIEEAVAKQRKCGTLFSLPGDLEIELAERISKIIPFAERVRFGMNGSDATTGAVRVARAYTGRDHIAKCGYHGWSDWSIATHPLRRKGEPLSVFVGKKEIMSVLDGQDVFFSFTYAGYLPSIAASLAMLDFMGKNEVQKKLWSTGNLLLKKYQALAEKYDVPTKAMGIGPHPIFAFKDAQGADNLALKSLFLQETAKRGIFTNCSNLMNYSHEISDIEEVAGRLEEIFKIMEEAVSLNKVEVMLEGPMIRPR